MLKHLSCGAITPRRSVINKKKHSKKSRHNLRPPRNSRMVSHVLRRGSKAKLTSKFWRRILSDTSSSAGLQYIQQIGASSYTRRTIITSPRRLRKSYKPLIARECSYSICPIWKWGYKRNKEKMKEKKSRFIKYDKPARVFRWQKDTGCNNCSAIDRLFLTAPL